MLGRAGLRDVLGHRRAPSREEGSRFRSRCSSGIRGALVLLLLYGVLRCKWWRMFMSPPEEGWPEDKIWRLPKLLTVESEFGLNSLQMSGQYELMENYGNPKLIHGHPVWRKTELDGQVT